MLSVLCYNFFAILAHCFLIPYILSIRYLYHCRVVISQRCRRENGVLVQYNLILYRQFATILSINKTMDFIF